MFSPPHTVNIYCSKACSNRARTVTAESRFWRHVQKGDGCWLWTAGRSGDGYGAFTVEAGKQVGAHRFAYQLQHGVDPGAAHVLHTCDNPICVKGEHLFLGTHRGNMDDKVAKDRQQKGEAHGRAKLTEQQVREMRASSEPDTVFAAMYQLDTATIRDARTGKNWKHLN